MALKHLLLIRCVITYIIDRYVVKDYIFETDIDPLTQLTHAEEIPSPGLITPT